MKNILSYLGTLILMLATLTSCFDDQDDVFASDTTIKNFVWRGMNNFYLYKPEIEELSNDRFSSIQELETFHSTYDTPEAFFESLLFNQETAEPDEFFSRIVSDYVVLEQLIQGTTLNNGMEFGLVGENGSTTNIYGYVRYVIPGSNAQTQGIQRGMIFNQIDGEQLTRGNFSALLSTDTYTIGLANLNAGAATYNGTDISLTKSNLTENPIFITQVIDQGSQKVGYLMYNSFTANFDEQLNDVFGDFQAAGVTHLVLDLRYNGGGSVNSAITLGSLISGRPTTDVFSREQWNPDLQEFFENNQPDRLTNFFRNTTISGTTLNSLNLNKVYVITTGSSASASELVISALDPYIDVVQVGDNTAGKFQASITLYDSDNFGRENANPAHRYALQPLVLKSINSAGLTDFINGLTPDIMLREDFENLDVLGSPTEPLLAACLSSIQTTGTSLSQPQNQNQNYQHIGGSMELNPMKNEMYVESPSH